MLYLYKKEKTTTSIKSLKQTQSKAAQKCHRYSVSWVCPNLLPVGHGWNPIKITSAWSTSGGICNTAGPICLSISRSTLPSLVNETPSYLNFFLSGNSTLSWLRTMSSGAPQENYIMELEKRNKLIDKVIKMGTIENKTIIITSVRYDKIHLWGSTWTPVSRMRVKAVLL